MVNAFLQYGQRIVAARNARELIGHTTDYVLFETRCAAVGLLLADPLRIVMQPHYEKACREISASGPLEEFARRLLQQAEALFVRRGAAGGDWAALMAVLYDTWQTLNVVPLISRDVNFGVLFAVAEPSTELNHDDVSIVQGVAGLLALALDNLSGHARLNEMKRFAAENDYLRATAKTERDLRFLTGESQAMKAVRRAIHQVAATDSTVLIVGETGTGKELAARAIHQQSARREHLLVTINCAAFAPGVMASELFGHEAGAFTGAARKRLGRFEIAGRGTAFLDEIGELPLETQVMLLRVLQERKIERVGGSEPIPVDVRVIAATHRNLEAAVGAQRFRADLFYRLNVFPIVMPPLRERRSDIPDLVKHFIQHFGRRMHRPALRVRDATLLLLQEYAWPGNVRELENIVERAMIVSAGDELEVDPRWLKPVEHASDSQQSSGEFADAQRQAIGDALKRCHGKIYGPHGAAAALGLKPSTLYGKMRRLGLERRDHPF